jgi:hypothetical protein
MPLSISASRQQLGRGANTLFIGLVGDIRGPDIVPGAHHETLVDGDRHHRCMWKNKPDIEPRIEPQLGNDGLEIVPVSAETMQPDHAGVGCMHAGFDYQGFVSHSGSRSKSKAGL